jgi:hypothetical protein
MIISGVTKDVLRVKGVKVILTNDAQARLQSVEPLMVRPEYVVKDMFERKTYNKPQQVAIGPASGPCKGLAYSVELSDIKCAVID